MLSIREVFLKEYFSPLCTVSSLRYVPSKNKLQKKFNIMYKGLYSTDLYFLTFFMSQESNVTILIRFLLLNTNIKAVFSHHVQFFQNCMSKSKIYHKYRFIPIAFTLCLMKFLNIFQAHKVDRTAELTDEIHKLLRSSF